MAKKYITFIIISCALIYSMQAQEVEQKLTEAKSAYKDSKLEEARYALQEALSEVDIALGKEILSILPEKIDELESDKTKDGVTGTSAGYSGLYVNRNYRGSEEGKKTADIQIITDSPLLAGINSILTMPAIAMANNPDQKRIKVGGYKALMEKNEKEDGTISYDIQIPFGSSLLTFSCEGFSDEDQVIDMVNTIPVPEIVEKTR